MRALTDDQSRLVPVIQRYGGSIDKFLRDGIMATFGASKPTASYAADALRAIDDIMEAATAWAAERVEAGVPILRIGAAASAGRVIVGAVGDETRLEYTVIGDAVNRAAKLEKQNKTKQVRALADAATYQTAIGQCYAPAGELERRGARLIEGIDSPIDLVVMAG
jgi:adenylate cyclase